MTGRTLLCFVALAALGAPAQAETITGKVEADYVRLPHPSKPGETVGADVVFVVTRAGRFRVDDEAMSKTLYRFKGKPVTLDATPQPDETGATILTVQTIVKPVRWDGVAGAFSKSRPDSKHWSPRFTPKDGKTLKVFGRSYFATKKIAGQDAVIRGWYFEATGEVCVTAIQGEILESTILTRALVSIKGRVKAGDKVWVHGLSLFRAQVLVENAAGNVGHVLPGQVRIGEPAATPHKLGKRGLTQAVEQSKPE